MNLREGTRRLALLLGAVGAILGGFVSYLELQSILNQKERHDKFERLAASEVVQQLRKSFEVPELRPSQNPAPAKFDLSKGRVCPLDATDDSGCFTEVDKGGIKTIYWTKMFGVESIETQAGQMLYPAPTSSLWLYLFAAISPLLGFALPWGLIRAVGWVGAGFFASTK
jgi:hypothetical protein